MKKINNTNMVLRYYIGFENAEERFRILVDFLNKSGISRVILFSAPFAETSSIISLDYYKQHAEFLAPYVKKLKEIGIETGINVLHTNGHCFYADETEFGFARAVTVNNEQSRGSVCLADKKFLEHVKQEYKYYAALKPSVIFTDDDIRMISLGQFICLCDEHIKLISKRVGKSLTYEQIRKSIFSDTFEDDIVRNAFFEQIKADVDNLLCVIADSVHEVSPDTEIGIMTKGYPTSTADRNLKEFFKKFEDKKITRIRPGIDYYREGDYNSIPLEFSQPAILRDIIDNPKVEIQPEVENDTYGFYQKSNNITNMQLLWCITNGLRNMQVNIFPYDGVINYDEITSMFADNIDYHNKLNELIPEGHRTSGIGIYVHPESITKTRAKNGELIKDVQWIKWLNLIGLPVANNVKDSDFMMLTGDDIYLATDNEIDGILKKGAVIDLRAAEALCERGFGERIGIKKIEYINGIYAGERFTENDMNGEYKNSGNSDYIYSTILDKETIKQITYCDKTQILSYYIDHHKQKICDGIGAHQNENGERFVILPFSDNMFMFFTNVNHKRRRQLINCFEWIGGKSLPVISQNEKLCVNINCFEDKNVISLFNLQSDDINTIRLRYSPEGTLMYVHEKTGDLIPLEFRYENGGIVAIDKFIHSACVAVIVDKKR